ncbi:hypothetical protein M3Y94_00492800 [Aphelenchoides besseyi]|nr:hypothetical protein M3Y94_00492800 [Aphelenchoides besseyi]KAI6217929.1 hypothetical protein M3Y95_01195100 [Aphelenchoides besseyi]
MASIESENELDNSQSEYQAPVHSEVNEDVGNHTCDQCGIVYVKIANLTRHKNAHENTDGYQCSICGVCATTWDNRNTHEEEMHNFRRQTEVNRKEIARIRKDQLSEIGNVGFNLVRMQTSATLPPRGSDDASESEIVELESVNPTLESRKKICSFCEREFQTRFSYHNHIKGHKITDGYVCSCCGIQKEDAKKRNKHERNDHKFERTEPYSKIKEALKIEESQKEDLKEFGTNFDQVQRKAVAWIGAGLSGLRKRKLDHSKQLSIVDCINRMNTNNTEQGGDESKNQKKRSAEASNRNDSEMDVSDENLEPQSSHQQSSDQPDSVRSEPTGQSIVAVEISPRKPTAVKKPRFTQLSIVDCINRMNTNNTEQGGDKSKNQKKQSAEALNRSDSEMDVTDEKSSDQ